jgi:hypothetical protein
MAQSLGNKQQIAAAISANRFELQNSALLIRHNLDPRSFLLESQKKHLSIWMSLGVIFGWILSRLPARKIKIRVLSADPGKVAKRSNGGGVLKLFRDGGWSIGKPLLADYLTRKILKTARIRGAGLLPEILIWTRAFLKALVGQSKEQRQLETKPNLAPVEGRFSSLSDEF